MKAIRGTKAGGSPVTLVLAVLLSFSVTGHVVSLLNNTGTSDKLGTKAQYGECAAQVVRLQQDIRAKDVKLSQLEEHGMRVKEAGGGGAGIGGEEEGAGVPVIQKQDNDEPPAGTVAAGGDNNDDADKLIKEAGLGDGGGSGVGPTRAARGGVAAGADMEDAKAAAIALRKEPPVVSYPPAALSSEECADGYRISHLLSRFIDLDFIELVTSGHPAPENATIVDIGIYQSSELIHMAKRGFTIQAYEPNPVRYNICHTNIQREVQQGNSKPSGPYGDFASRINLRNLAVADTNKPLQFMVSDLDSHLFLNEEKGLQKKYAGPIITVNTTTMREVMERVSLGHIPGTESGYGIASGNEGAYARNPSSIAKKARNKKTMFDVDPADFFLAPNARVSPYFVKIDTQGFDTRIVDNLLDYLREEQLKADKAAAENPSLTANDKRKGGRQPLPPPVTADFIQFEYSPHFEFTRSERGPKAHKAFFRRLIDAGYDVYMGAAVQPLKHPRRVRYGKSPLSMLETARFQPTCVDEFVEFMFSGRYRKISHRTTREIGMWMDMLAVRRSRWSPYYRHTGWVLAKNY